jgi:metal-responsive CopG/Arc/MetJ family transcriptional regulator
VRAIRLSDEFLAKVDAWAERQDDQPGRSEAIRRLVEMGLTVKSRPKRASRAGADKANAMAANQLDRLADKSAPAEEQASRKRRLLKGPEEFQGVRVDRPATKK